MLNDEIKNIVEFGEMISNIDGMYDNEKEDSKYTKILEKGFTKIKDKKEKISGITKPLIEDNGFIIFNKIKDFVLKKFRENNNEILNMFGGKKIEIPLSQIVGDIDINVLSELYVKEIYGNDIFNRICEGISSNIPNEIIFSVLNNASGYGDIKLLFKDNCKIKNINKQGEDKIIVVENNSFRSWYFYLYFIDTETKEVRSFFNDIDIKEILLKLSHYNENKRDIEKLTGKEYVFMGNGKIPIINKISNEDLRLLKNNYYFGKEVISKKFTISWYGISIEIIPSKLNILLNKDELYNVLNFIEKEIEKYNEQSKDKTNTKDKDLSIKFNLFNLLYNLYTNFINNNISTKEGLYINIIPFTFIFRDKKNNSVIEIINGVSLNNILKIMDNIKGDLLYYEKYKNISNDDILTIINRLLYKDVCFSGFINEKGYAPQNDYLLKIKFIKKLLLGDKFQAYNIIRCIPDFIKKEKIKYFNGNSKSNGFLGKWYIYDTINELIGEKDKNIKKESYDIDKVLQVKNKELLNLIKNYLEINKNFIEKLILRSKLNNIEDIKSFLFEKLIYFTLKDTNIRLEGKKTYLNNILNKIDIVDILFIIQSFIQDKEINEKENGNLNGILYDENKRFLFSGFVNNRINKNNKMDIIFDFISKIYINLPNKRYILKYYIKYFYNNLDNLKDIEIFILKTLIK